MSEGSSVQTGNFWLDFMIGGVSAAVAKTATAPIERIKLVLQTQDSNEEMKKRGLKYKGIGDCFFGILKNDGPVAFWRGNLANVIRYFPTQALNFAFIDFYKRTFNPYNAKKEKLKFFIGNILSGGAAGATSLCIVYPLDFARTRLATDMGKTGADRQFNGMVDCISKIFKSDGLPGLYRGFGISVLGIMAYRGCYFGMYDTGKEVLLPANCHIVLKFCFAQFVTGTSGVFSYPFDTVRRRLMMMSGKKKSKDGAVSQVVHYKGTTDCFQKIWELEGYRGFFRGALSNFFRGVGASLVLVMYDEIQAYILKSKLKAI